MNTPTDTASPIRLALDHALESLHDPKRAAQQQAYMKSAMPYAGLTAPVLKQTYQQIFKDHPCASAAQWQRIILELWREAAARESRYVAVALLLLPRYRKAWLTPERLPLLRELIENGAWWDYVDNLASNGMGHLLRVYPAEIKPVVSAWAQEENLWLRRSAILSQLKFGQDTDQALLFAALRGSLDDNDFFARKAIGWALRQYSRTDPKAVIAFIEEHKQTLSGLSKREGLRILTKQGYFSD